MKNEKMFKEYMSLFGEMFDKEISDILKTTYWEILKPFADDQCENAFKKVITTAKFFPKPSEILEYLQEGVPHMLAWKKALTALKEIGPYASVNFQEDPAIHLTIELMGGWPEFCKMEYKDIKWKQIEFEKIYKGVCQKGSFPKYLPGIHEQENLRTRHLEYESRVLVIGGPRKRKLLNQEKT